MKSETGIEVGLRRGFHAMIAYDMGKKCRAMLDVRPTREFAGLEPGKTYCYKPPCGDHRELLTVGEMTPKRTQAIAAVNHREPRRIYKGSYTGTFVELDADLIALAEITHQSIVAAAVAAGLEVPPEVRREYPALFVEIPERFATGNSFGAQRVAQALKPAPFQRTPVGVADVDRFIEHAHSLLEHVRCERTRRGALNPDMGQDYERMANGHVADIDFYRWLRRQIDVGGVFHIPAERAPAAA